MTYSQKTTIFGNAIHDNRRGIFCWDTEKLLVYENDILTNDIGIQMLDCQGSIYQNNFINNTVQINSDGGVYGNDPSDIIWYNVTARQGNYWSDYNGTDMNEDHIGDTPHIFDLNYTDSYPLVNPLSVSASIENENGSVRDMQLLVVFVVILGGVVTVICLLVFLNRRHYFIKKPL